MTGSDKAIPHKDSRSNQWLRNHWTRPLGALGYYWFLTFEGALQLRALVKKCQESTDLPFYDTVSPDSLHLTIDRIAPAGELAADQLESITASAIQACRAVLPFELEINQLSIVPSAVTLDVSPVQDIHHLRETLRSATLSACPELQLGNRKPHPTHISIAYANADNIPALDTTRAVEKMNDALQRIDVAVTEALLVFLERRQRSYSWQIVAHIPLTAIPHGTA